MSGEELSLKEKLARISEEAKGKKAEEESKNEAKRLAPVYKHIKELEESRRQFDLIKGSLEIKTGSAEPKFGGKMGLGMEEYTNETDKSVQKNEGALDSLIAENEEAMEVLGLSDQEVIYTLKKDSKKSEEPTPGDIKLHKRTKIAEHEDFDNTKEVVAYKKSGEQKKGLAMSDAALQKKLIKLGVEISEEDKNEFSYQKIEQVVDEKIKKLDEELLSEKMKTPEGRIEAVDILAEEFAMNTGSFEIGAVSITDKNNNNGYNQGKEDSSYVLDFKNPGNQNRNNSFRFQLFNNKTVLKNYYDLDLIPANLEEKKNSYGDEIVLGALEKNAQNKVREAFTKYDEKNGCAVSLKKQLELINPGKKDAIRNMLGEYNHTKTKFLDLVRTKSEELKAKGIDFSSSRILGGYYTYQDIAGIDMGESIRSIDDDLNLNIFPPKYNYEKLLQIIVARQADLNSFMEMIKNINNEDDLKAAQNNENNKNKSTINELSQRISKYSVRDARFEFKNIPNRVENDLASKCRNYHEASRYLDEKIKINNDAADKILEKVKEANQRQLILAELGQAAKKDNLGDGFLHNVVRNVESLIKKTEENRKDATELMEKIINLQAELPQNEELNLHGSCVYIPSIEKQAKDLSAERQKSEDELKEKDNNINAKKLKNPLFGKDKLKKEIETLAEEKLALEKKISDLKKEETTANNKQYKYVKANEYSEVAKFWEEQKATGLAKDIFNNSKKELIKLIDKKVSPELLQKYNEYKKLDDKLRSELQ
jgi:hypothetical protein